MILVVGGLNGFIGSNTTEGIWDGQGLKAGCLGFGKFPGKVPRSRRNSGLIVVSCSLSITLTVLYYLREKVGNHRYPEGPGDHSGRTAEEVWSPRGCKGRRD